MKAAVPISVVIPTHDRAEVLPHALDSVLQQTLQPAEVVVVDDGADDDTAAVVGAYGDHVRYVRLPTRSGAQAARNRGIREASGDWIAFQDSDDTWLPDKLERQVALLAERDFEPWTVVHGPGREPMRGLLENEEDALDALLRRPATLFPALLVSRSALERIGGLDEQVPAFHEWETSIRLAHFCRFVAPEQPVVVWTRTEANALSNSHLLHIRGYQYVIDKFRDEILERCGEDAWRAHIRRQVRNALEFELWDEARRLLELTPKREPRYWAYAFCARLGLRPSAVKLRAVKLRVAT